MRMDIENSPGALAGHKGQAARDRLGLRHFGAGAMCGNCLCCMQLRDPRRERRVTTLIAEYGCRLVASCSVNLECRRSEWKRRRRPKWRDDKPG
jgi:hypothetical protein